MTRFYRLMVATAAIFGVTSAARADGPASGEVTGVSVQPSPGRADVIVNVRGAVEVRDFMLENPSRLVLDVVGAKLKRNAASSYDGVRRGGVLNLRYSQDRKSTRLNSSHANISYAVFCLKKKKKTTDADSIQ